MVEASVDNEPSLKAERRGVDPNLKFALGFVRDSEDRQNGRLAEAEARADQRHRELIAALNVLTTRMGTHADAQRVILALIALVVLMALLLAAVRGADVGAVGEAAGRVVGGAVGTGS